MRRDSGRRLSIGLVYLAVTLTGALSIAAAQTGAIPASSAAPAASSAHDAPAAPAIPPVPHAFYGTVTIYGAPAPAGSSITARGQNILVDIPGNPFITTTAGEYGGPGRDDPKLIVQGNDSLANGTPIEFYVNGVRAQCAAADGAWQATYPFTSGATTQLNLRIVDVTETPTATPTRTPPDAHQDTRPNSTSTPTTTRTATATERPTETRQRHPRPAPRQQRRSPSTPTVTLTSTPTASPTPTLTYMDADRGADRHLHAEPSPTASPTASATSRPVHRVLYRWCCSRSRADDRSSGSGKPEVFHAEAVTRFGSGGPAVAPEYRPG